MNNFMAPAKEQKPYSVLTLPSVAHPYVSYVDEFGEERRLYLWVEGTRFHIADMERTQEYSIEGSSMVER